MLTRRILALEFAELLASEVKKDPWLARIRGADEGSEHKALAPLINTSLSDFLQRNGEPPAEGLFDWEGNSDRTPPQSRSYELLGTSAHPDAAILRPFSCAIEVDRQATSRGPSHLKQPLMKAACHVLSGAYDAAVFVYILNKQGETSADYLESHPFTKQLVATLRAHGLVAAIIEPA